MPRRAFALAAHPDDIEFQMAGTLILLGRAGYEIHYMNIANGSCGTAELAKEEITAIRRAEAQAAAGRIGALYHDSLVDDLAIFYEPVLLGKITAILREVVPEILLLQSPQDYMEDHQNAARLGVTAAFARGMRNFATDPPRSPVSQPVTVYHAQPHGNRDPLRRLVRPDLYVDISAVLAEKGAGLALHASQKTWLDRSQAMDAYLAVMEANSRAVGEMSGVFQYAEGWRRRLHYGFCDESADPLASALAGLVKVEETDESQTIP
jgi:LmbE family N-acetylglucosaminyl deacetylase